MNKRSLSPKLLLKSMFIRSLDKNRPKINVFMILMKPHASMLELAHGANLMRASSTLSMLNATPPLLEINFQRAFTTARLRLRLTLKMNSTGLMIWKKELFKRFQ